MFVALEALLHAAKRRSSIRRKAIRRVVLPRFSTWNQNAILAFLDDWSDDDEALLQDAKTRISQHTSFDVKFRQYNKKGRLQEARGLIYGLTPSTLYEQQRRRQAAASWSATACSNIGLLGNFFRK